MATTTSNEAATLLTLNEIGKAIGVGYYTVDRIVKRLGIAPARRVGVFKLFDGAALDRVKAEIEAREAKATTKD